MSENPSSNPAPQEQPDSSKTLSQKPLTPEEQWKEEVKKYNEGPNNKLLKKAQIMLKELGFYKKAGFPKATPDGNYGGQTKAAIETFQKTHNGPNMPIELTVNGLMSEAVMSRLEFLYETATQKEADDLLK